MTAQHQPLYTTNDLARIQAESGCDQDTIRRYERHAKQRGATIWRIERAAASLGLPVRAAPEDNDTVKP